MSRSSVFRPNRLRHAIVAAVAASAATGQAAIEEVVVTATKRAASAQDVPITVQALDENSLEDLNVDAFADYVRYLPSVTAGGRGPGQQTVYIRGMAVQPITVLLSGAQGTTPNVAFYLDEQPVTAPGRNLDVYATDIQRIEVLKGPQGTLFGASSQAGTVRLITNKPQFDGFAVKVDGEIGTTRYGENSTAVEATINVPVNERLAFRAALYSVNDGGYIDNVPGTFTTDPSINPLSTATPGAVSYAAANNVELAEDDFNDSYYQGGRLSASILLGDDWDLLLQHTQQELGADGVFDYDPEVGDLEVNRFFKDELEDEFGLTTWTLTGRLGALEMVYTGGYLDRDIDQYVDYTGYNNSGAFVSYYTCTYTSTYDSAAADLVQADYITPDGRECLNPVKGAIIDQSQQRTTHEFRINTPAEHRLRLTAGVFYDDFEIETVDDYAYLAVQDLGFAPNAPISTAVQIDPSTRAPGIAFFNDIRRTEEQIAVFGELSFDLLPDTLELIAGARYYEFELDFEGSSNFANGIFTTPLVALDDQDSGRDYDTSGGHTADPIELDDVITKFTLNWTPSEDLLFFATYSEGFRPGGFNRGGGLPSVNPDFPTVQTTYETDDVKNYELGWKTQLFDGLMQFNGNAYYVEWTDMQVSRFDPQNVSILTFIENGADSEIRGIEGDIIWAPTENLQLFGAFSYNDTELTEISAQIVELAPLGSELPLVPELQATFRARYDWYLQDGYNVYAQAAAQYADKSYSSLVAADRREQDSYATYDAALGVTKDAWKAEVFLENFTDERADLFINTQDDIRRVTTNRPRTVSLRFSVSL